MGCSGAARAGPPRNLCELSAHVRSLNAKMGLDCSRCGAVLPTPRSLRSHPSQMTTQGKYWCFTFNNPSLTPDAFSSLIADLPDFQYLLFQEEQVTTRHFQGYLEFSKLKRLQQLKKIDSGIHWERRQGTQSQAMEYVRKEESRIAGPFERGVPTETAQGHRSDLEEAVATLRSGGISAVAREHPATFVRNSVGLFRLASLISPPKPVLDVVLLYGPTETGKTRRFFDTFTDPDARWASPTTNGYWFDGYAGQPAALLDEFGGKLSGWKLSDTLRVLDRYPLQVPVKGGFVWWTPGSIYITSNHHPSLWWDYDGRSTQYDALARRFSSVVWWKSKGDPCVVLSRSSTDEWQHFWRGPQSAQLDLDRESGRLVSNAVNDYFNF